MKKQKTHRRHWYRVYVGECPICGRAKSFRLRVYGAPPRDRRKRYVQLSLQDSYDYCDI